MPFRALFTNKVSTKVCSTTDWWQARCWARNCRANRPQHIGNHGKCHGQVDTNILKPSCCTWIWLILPAQREYGLFAWNLLKPSQSLYHSKTSIFWLLLAFHIFLPSMDDHDTPDPCLLHHIHRWQGLSYSLRSKSNILQATPSLAQFKAAHLRMSNQQLHVTQVQVCQVQISGLSNPLVKERCNTGREEFRPTA